MGKITKKPAHKKGSLIDPEKLPPKCKTNFDYPVFCFKYLDDNFSLKGCDIKLYENFISRLKKLSILGFKEISTSERHSFGYELLPKETFKISKLPEIITDEVQKLYVFRYGPNNLPFVAYRRPNTETLHLLAIESKHNNLYNHGKKK